MFLQKYSKAEDIKLKKTREDLQNRLDFLRKQAEVRVIFFVEAVMLFFFTCLKKF